MIAALALPGVAAAVDSWSVSRYELASGTDGSNRLLALELDRRLPVLVTRPPR